MVTLQDPASVMSACADSGNPPRAKILSAKCRKWTERKRPARYKYFPGSGGPEPPAGAGGRLSGPPLPVPLPPCPFLSLPLEVLTGAPAGPGCVAPCATLTFELPVVCGAFCACVTVASAKRLTHITDPRIRIDIVGPSWNCRSTTALNPRGAVFSSVISALCRTFPSSRRVRFSLDSGHIVACPTGEKSQQAQTHRGKNVQSVGSLLINNHSATQALRASNVVIEFCVPAGVIEHWTTSRSWSSLAFWAWPSCSLSRG